MIVGDSSRPRAEICCPIFRERRALSLLDDCPAEVAQRLNLLRQNGLLSEFVEGRLGACIWPGCIVEHVRNGIRTVSHRDQTHAERLQATSQV